MDFKIKIEDEFNQGSQYINKWLVKFDINNTPIFTDNEDEAGIFSIGLKSMEQVYPNLEKLYDGFDLVGTPINTKVK